MLWHLYLECAFPKREALDFGHFVLHVGFEDDIVAGDAQIDVAVADKGGYVSRWEEHAVAGQGGAAAMGVGVQCDGVVDDEADVETV